MPAMSWMPRRRCEAVALDVAGGGCDQCAGRLGVAVATQWTVFPLFGLHATLQENLVIGLIFTAVSLVRSYLLRRAFEGLRVRQLSGNSG